MRRKHIPKNSWNASGGNMDKNKYITFVQKNAEFHPHYIDSLCFCFHLCFELNFDPHAEPSSDKRRYDWSLSLLDMLFWSMPLASIVRHASAQNSFRLLTPLFICKVLWKHTHQTRVGVTCMKYCLWAVALIIGWRKKERNKWRLENDSSHCFMRPFVVDGLITFQASHYQSKLPRLNPAAIVSKFGQFQSHRLVLVHPALWRSPGGGMTPIPERLEGMEERTNNGMSGELTAWWLYWQSGEDIRLPV